MPSEQLKDVGLALSVGGGCAARQEPRFASVPSDGAFKLVQAAALKQIGKVVSEEIVSFDDVRVMPANDVDEAFQKFLLFQFPAVDDLFPPCVVCECHGKDPVLGFSRIA